MPIRINLLAEAQAAEEMRRNDPVKRGIWVGAFLVALVGIWALEVQMEITTAKSQFANAENSWKSKDPFYAAVTNTQNRIADIDQKLAALDRLTTNRFLWAPVLNALQKAALNDVSVTEFRGGQSLTPLPNGVSERIEVSILARDNNPSAQGYNKFKEALNQSDYFIKNVGRKDSFVIDGVLSPITADPNDPTRQFMTFTLASHFPELHHAD